MKRQPQDPELIIDRQMKGVKFKRTRIPTIHLSDQPGQKFEYRYTDGYSLADWGYHKKDGYTITHIPSGKKAYITHTAKQARELVYRFYLMPTLWDGEGEIPAEFVTQGYKALDDYTKRKPIRQPQEF